MKQKWLAMLCAFALLITLLPFSQAAEAPAAKAEREDRTVLVGMAYGSSVLPSADLQNAVGSGYRLGYLDENREFQQLGFTQEQLISVVITQNVWYGDDNGYTCYSEMVTSDIFVGCWHVQHPIAVNSFEEASAAAAQIEGGFPAWVDGVWSVRSGSYATRNEALEAVAGVEGAVLGETSAYGVSVLKKGTSRILFQFDGGEDLSLTVKPGPDDSVKTVTLFRDTKYYGAFQYSRLNGGNLTVVNALPMSDYISCVISREMSPSWPIEALKAQAVCARNYYETSLGRHAGFDLCSTGHCQAYPGMSDTNDRTAQAVAETAGLRAWYQGRPANTYYFSSDGGATEDVRNVWSDNADMPYLCGVIDPYEALVADKNPRSSWTVTYTASELTELLQEKGYGNAAIVDFRVTALTPTGNVKAIAFIDASGSSWPFTKEKVRTFLGLNSIRYSITASGETFGGVYYVQDGSTLSTMTGVYAIGGDGSVKPVSEDIYVISGSGEVEQLPPPYGGTATGEILFTINGSGWGHSVGMSQWGAYSMATQGCTFDQILKFYYPGVEIY